MDGEGMDDLSDGVNKLTEFSAVLSSVTRTLDKNVRRLEGQFGKCNESLKRMDETVAENTRVAQSLQVENDAQVQALVEAVAISANMPETAALSEFMGTKDEVKDIRTASIVNREREEEKDAVNFAENEAKLYAELTPWAKLVDESTSADSIQTRKGANMTVHKLVKSLRMPVLTEVKEGLGEPVTKLVPPDGAYPFPTIDQDSGVGGALSAMIQRMHRLENAVSLQTSVNEALMKMVRDDSSTRAVYESVASNINSLHTDMREIGISQTKLRSTLKSLADHVQEFEGKAEDVVTGGRLRNMSRKERGCKDEDGLDIEGPTILNGLDAYTINESDRLATRIAVVEGQLSANGAMGVALRRLNSDVEELQNEMVDRREEAEAMKKFQEENSSATFILKKNIEWSKAKWEAALTDINFALNYYSDRVGLDHNVDDASSVGSLKNGSVNKEVKEVESKGEGEEEEEDDGEEEEDDGEEEEDEEEEDSKPVEESKGCDDASSRGSTKSRVPRSSEQDPDLIRKLNDLYSAVENGLKVNTFLVRDNVEETLDLLVPMLDDLTVMIEEIFTKDHELRLGVTKELSSTGGKEGDSVGSSEAVTLSMLMTEDRKFNLREVMYEALKSSLPIIDERVDKITLRRRIEKIEGGSVMQEEIKKLETRHSALEKKVENVPTQDQFQRAFARAAKKVDLQKFRDVMFMRLDLNEEEIQSLNAIVEESISELHEQVDGVHQVAFKSDHVGSSGFGGQKVAQQSPGSTVNFSTSIQTGASSADVKQMSTRMEMLLNQFQDLQKDCTAFIPREEVQEALKAVLYELKLLKMNTINVNKFNEEIEKKADYDEMKNLMEILSSALGDLMGKNVSAAAKSRCLMCDKPVSGTINEGRQSTRGRQRSASPSRQAGHRDPTPNRGPLESNNKLPDEVERPGSSQPRLAGSQSTNNLPTREDARAANLKIQSEVTVLRNSIDLPAIDSGKPDARPPGKMLDQFKSRVRSAGGGGNVVYN